MNDNLILMTDSYKVGHHAQYPPGTKGVYSYLEARKGGEYKEIVFFGLQYILKRYLTGRVINRNSIIKAKRLFSKHFNNPHLFNLSGWMHILDKHNGHLPIVIKAVPEGMVIHENNVLMTVENTCPMCAWVVNYFESLLLHVWYPSTVATISREIKKIVNDAILRSSDSDPSSVLYKIHDFGYRGVSSSESAISGGAGHLVNFMGTDNLPAISMLMDYYNSDVCAHSIPAAEHSTITSWGKDFELEAYRNMLKLYPDGLVAVVSDSWDIRNAVSNIWGGTLKQDVIQRDGVLVIRPDSGDPREVLPEIFGILADKFGCTRNSKGYKVLNPKVAVIQGDGIKRSTLSSIIDSVLNAGYSIDSLSFGSGGGLLQDCNRDTQRFAFKCSSVNRDGIWSDVYKQPATDPTKDSKRGRLMLARTSDGFITLPEGTAGFEDVLVKVFENGRLLVNHNFEDVRKRAVLS